MSFNEQSLRQAARLNVSESFKKSQESTIDAASLIIENNIQRKSVEDKIDAFDIFLSHNFLDAEVILGILNKLKDFGYRVYVDWVIDTHLDRSRITTLTSQTLKSRMNQCRCLLFASTKNAPLSKWMPWELGYMDGKKDKAAIIPIYESEDLSSHEFKGQEYLGIYPYCIHAEYMYFPGREGLWILENEKKSVPFNDWLAGKKPSLLK